MKNTKFFYILTKEKTDWPNEIHRYDNNHLSSYYEELKKPAREAITERKANALIRTYTEATGGHGGGWKHYPLDFVGGYSTHLI